MPALLAQAAQREAAMPARAGIRMRVDPKVEVRRLEARRATASPDPPAKVAVAQ
jgi:hypothetical protein